MEIEMNIYFHYRGSDESVHKLERAGIAEGNEARAKGEIYCASSQFHGKSLFENSI
jgi:hypothetical protein